MGSTTYQDPMFPLIQLPARFRARRQSTDRKVARGETIDIFNARGPGCIRHIWFCPSSPAEGNPELTIRADEAPEPQVAMDAQSFLGVLLDQKPYRFDAAPFQHLPMTEGPVQGSGYNCYLPIPFATSCRITFRATEDLCVSVMIDWQQYPAEMEVTPYRLHAVHRAELPARHRGSFLMADISGSGFLAGIVKGLRQRDFSDMIYHTKGQLWLIDGESDPHAINGHNEEDDFSFFWGYQPIMTPWIGCPYHRHAGRESQDGVIYRFFGPDPVPFASSMLLRCGSRADDTETVVYWYGVAGSTAAPVQSPEKWQLTGPFPCPDFQQFLKAEFPEKLPVPWPGRVREGGQEWPVYSAESEHTWIDFWRFYRNGGSPEALVGHAAYARATVECEKDRAVLLRFGFDDWLSVWLNGERLASVRHDDGFVTVSVPARLRRGRNELLVKLSNFENLEKRLYVLSCAICEKTGSWRGAGTPQAGPAGRVSVPPKRSMSEDSASI